MSSTYEQLKLDDILDHLTGQYTPSSDKILYLRDLIPIIRNREIVKMNLDQVDYEEVIDSPEARSNANKINFNTPSLVVKLGDRYQLLDDPHKIFKLKYWNMTEHIFFIVSLDEIEPHFRCSKTGLKLNEKRIELKTIHDCFGFPIPVFKYLNHQKFKTDLYEEYSKDLNDWGSTYTGTNRTKNIILNQTPCSLDLLKATISAYDCFYRHIYGSTYADKIEITHSWMVETPPWNGESQSTNPMSAHKHFLSLACSTYYLEHETGFGGDLRIMNPICEFSDQMAELYIMNRLNPTKGYTRFFDVPVDESDIVVFSGALKHTIGDYTNKKAKRVSIPTNSTINPLRSTYTMSENGRIDYGYRYDIKGHHTHT